LVTAQQNEAAYYPYVLAPIACTAFVYVVLFFFPFPDDCPAAPDAVQACIDLVGTMGAFWANGGYAGVHFLRRYFSICWVLSVRFCIFFIPFFALWVLGLRKAVLSTFLQWPPMSSDRRTEICDEANAWLTIAVMALFFWRLCVHLRDLYRSTAGANSVERGIHYEHRTSASSEPSQSSGR